MLLAGATVALVLAAIVVVVSQRPDAKISPDQNAQQLAHREPSREGELPRPPARPGTPPRSHNGNAAANNRGSEVAVNNPPPASIPVAPPAAIPTVMDAKADETVTKALTAARAALAKNDVRGARTQIEQARQAQASHRAVEIDRLEALAKYIEEFWRAVREGIKGAAVAGELTVKGKVMAVVEARRVALVLRVDGMNRTFPVNDLSPDMAYALAEGWLRKGEASTNIILGAYQAMQPRGDRRLARQLWQSAATSGAKEAAELVLPELDVPLPVEVPVVVEGDVKPGADGRFALPGASAQSQARAEVKQMFESEYDQAKEGAAKLALAAKLRERAEQSGDTAAVRYILWSEAARLAGEAGDFAAMMAAWDKLAERFAVEAIAEKADALFEVSKTAQGQDLNKALAAAALAACDEAVLLDKIDAALKIARTALAAARKSGDRELIKQASEREREVRDLKK
jgi:hypothetical protein